MHLFSVLNPLVSAKATGVLTVNNEFGSTAKVILSKGKILDIKLKGLSIVDAAKELAMWVSVITEFTPRERVDIASKGALRSEGLLNMLEKLEQKVIKIQRIVPNNDATFIIDPAKDDNDLAKLSSGVVKTARILDGRKTIREVVAEIGISELEVLQNIYKLWNQGIIKMVGAFSPEDEKKVDFWKTYVKSLNECLAELVGPAADIIVGDAFDSVGTTPKKMDRSDVPRLVEAISKDLDNEERAALMEVSNKYLKDAYKLKY